MTNNEGDNIKIYMQFNIISIFPNLIKDYCSESLLGKAQKKKLLKIKAVDLRDFASDKHKTVDDTSYGGGAGMVMKVEPIFKALQFLNKSKVQNSNDKSNPKSKILKQKIIMLSPRGKQFDQKMAKKFAKLDKLTLICGRYEGVDQRVVDKLVDEEVSVGPYVLQGGELGALIITEAVSRFVPGVLGNPKSLDEETFSTSKGEYHQQMESSAGFTFW
jgi:tRNA (guanine37-N1)-methyltransferase